MNTSVPQPRPRFHDNAVRQLPRIRLLLLLMMFAPGCNGPQTPDATAPQAAHDVNRDHAQVIEPHVLSSAQRDTHTPSPTAIQVEIRDIAIQPPDPGTRTRHVITCRVGIVNTSGWPEYIDKTLLHGSAIVAPTRGEDRLVPDAAGPPQGFGVFSSRNLRDDIIYLRPGEFWGRQISIAVTPNAICRIDFSYKPDPASPRNAPLSEEGVALWTGGSSKSVSVEIEDGVILAQ